MVNVGVGVGVGVIKVELNSGTKPLLKTSRSSHDHLHTLYSCDLGRL